MEPILDETTLVPCSVRPTGTRIAELAKLLRALDSVGAPRVLRSVRDAVDRDLGGGRGMRGWCFDRATPREAGLLVANRLASQPYVDGEGGLFAAAEGARAVEARRGGKVVVGAGLAALTDGIVASLTSSAQPAGGRMVVELTFVDEEGERREEVEVRAYATADEVDSKRDDLVRRVESTLVDGRALLRRISEVFPRLRLGPRVEEQLEALSGGDPTFYQLVRHLRALDAGPPVQHAGRLALLSNPSCPTV